MSPSSARSVCVFCGSRSGHSAEYATAATRLGTVLANQGHRLVCGGGQVGLMGTVADAVLANGGNVLGVITRQLARTEIAHPRLTRLEVVATMHERKALMAAEADAFVALPGGLGTFDELFEILTWSQLEIHAKPVGLLNTNQYFDPLISMIDHAIEEGFCPREQRELLVIGDDPLELIQGLLPTQS
jgi:uncharacterized protein (TIGR00730 family)